MPTLSGDLVDSLLDEPWNLPRVHLGVDNPGIASTFFVLVPVIKVPEKLVDSATKTAHLGSARDDVVGRIHDDTSASGTER